MAFLGVILVVFNGSVILNLNPAGDLLAIGAAFSWAIYGILLKGVQRTFLQLPSGQKAHVLRHPDLPAAAAH